MWRAFRVRGWVSDQGRGGELPFAALLQGRGGATPGGWRTDAEINVITATAMHQAIMNQ